MMKANLLLISLIVVGIATPALANNSQKIAVVEHMFEDARTSSLFDDNSNSIVSLAKYSSKPLKHALLSAYKQANDEYGGLTSCGETLYYYHLEEGGSYSVSEINDLEVSAVGNNRVRAIAYVDGMSTPGIREYSVQCKDNSCLIYDAYDTDGESALDSLKKYCN